MIKILSIKLIMLVCVCVYLFLGMRGILVSLSGVHRELSWLLSVVKDTESDMRDGEEQLLLFWLLLATVSSSNESASLLSSEPGQTENDISSVCVSYLA